MSWETVPDNTVVTINAGANTYPDNSTSSTPTKNKSEIKRRGVVQTSGFYGYDAGGEVRFVLKTEASVAIVIPPPPNDYYEVFLGQLIDDVMLQVKEKMNV